ncbi:MAG: sugar phosphate isomerase/epimerase [Chloroflexi bacterium]|nr:sugar phosphate isomerase/epimerase [Chloroflexota bacterium]
MQLSLSTRVAEAPKRKDVALMRLPELAGLASDAGYRALCMRASQLGVQSGDAELKAASKLLDSLKLKVSMVTGNIDVPANNERAGMALREIERHCNVAEALGASLIRIGMKAHTDIPWARWACDLAAERGIRLAHQCHTCTLFETVEMTLQVVKEVGRPNFGIIYEPSNLMTCGQDYGIETIGALAPLMFNVYLQNMWNHPDGMSTIETWINGPVKFDLVPFGDPRGVDFRLVFDGLSEAGYAGYVTVHHNVADGLDIRTGVRQFADYLRSVGQFDP